MATPPTRAVVELCTAPKILSAAPCRRPVAAPGAGVCLRHLGTDPERRCQGDARGVWGDSVGGCHAWPLLTLPFCSSHDPQHQAVRRRQQRAAATIPLARVRGLLTDTPPDTLRGALELLILKGKVTPQDIEAAVDHYRWLMAGLR